MPPPPHQSPNHIQHLFIYSSHTFYSPKKDRILTQEFPVVHYPSEVSSTEEAQLISLSLGLCDFVDENYVQVASSRGKTTNNGHQDEENGDEDHHTTEQDHYQQEENNKEDNDEDHDDDQAHPQTPHMHHHQHHYKKHNWTTGSCHTLMNKNTQWIFRPFNCRLYDEDEHLWNLSKEERARRYTENTVFRTRLVICFVVEKDNLNRNYKLEFGQMINDIWSTFNIFYATKFNPFSFKSQFPVMNRFIMEYIQPASNGPILSQGISFLTIGSYLFVRIQAFIHRVIEQFSHALHPQTIFMFQRYVLFSSLDHNESRLISNHVGKLYSPHIQKPHNHFLFRTGPLAVDLSNAQFAADGSPSSLKHPFSTKMPSVSVNSVQYARIPTSASDSQTEQQKFISPDAEEIPVGSMYTAVKTETPDASNNRQYLLVVDYNNIQIHWLMKEGYQDNEQVLLQLQEYAQPYLDKLNTIIADKMSAIHAFDECYKYLYYNHMNLAIMSSLLQKTHSSQLAVYQHHIQNLRNQFLSKSNHGLREVYFKARKDLWIFGKFFGQREFYILYDQKAVSLTEFSQEVGRVMSIFFSSRTTKR